MLTYILKRLFLIIPTLLGIITINFFIVQLAPGGPVEQTIARLEHQDTTGTDRVSGVAGDVGRVKATSDYRASRGINPEILAHIKKQYGFDKPILERYLNLLKNYAKFDLGNSFYRNKSVLSLIWEKLPVSISLGLWSTLIIYIISILLGIRKAVKAGSSFDTWTSSIIIVGNAIPVFLFAIVLIVLFAGGSYFTWFPLRGLTSSNFSDLPWWKQIYDYFWHICLPVLSISIAGFASLTMLTKNFFLDEINKQYVITARSKGLSEKGILRKHVFRNATLLIVAGFPGAFIGIIFASSMLIEIIFSLNGLGLLGFQSAITRDYPVMFGTLYLLTLLGLLASLLGDILYTIIDPRINFNSRK